jgi:hypothetical protein
MSRVVAAIALIMFTLAQATESNPISKVLQMLSELQGTIISQASDAQKVYDKYVSYCEDRSHNLGLEIKNGKSDRDSLQARIDEETANIGALTARIEDLSADSSSSESDLQAATSLRDKEAADFAAEEHDLVEILESLGRAVTHLTKKGGAALLQEKSADSVTEALVVMVDATAISSEDASRLTALVQERSLEKTEEADSSDDDDDSELELGAPAPAAHKSRNSGVISTLEGLYERAEGQLNKLRETEATARQNYERLKASLTNEIKLAAKDMNAAKIGVEASQEAKSVASGDLTMTIKDLERDTASKEALHHECMTAAQAYQSATKARDNELGALAASKKAIEQIRAEAESSFAQQLSFAQLTSQARSRTKLESTKFQVVHFVRKLASRLKSAALTQLASRLSSEIHLSTTDEKDPFAKVRSMIEDMISQLVSAAETEAQHKAYCDKQLASTDAQREETSAELDSLTSKTNQKVARSAKTREQISTLQKELADIARAKAEASELRREEGKTFLKSKGMMERSLSGIKLALKILREHYGSADAGGAGGIISLLEVVESDFTQGLAGLVVEEEGSANYYNSETKHGFDMETAAKENNMKYKTKEYMSMNKAVNEMSGDLSGLQNRLNAVNEFGKTLAKTCGPQPDSYEERKKRRDEEIDGLKQALEILEGTSFLQFGSSHKLRGARQHSA